MEGDAFRDLHPMTSEILSALIASGIPEARATKSQEKLLARFAAGWITDDEREEAILALADSEHLRLRLLEIRDSVKRASTSIRARAEVSERDPVVGEVLSEAAASLVDTFGRWREACAGAFANSQPLLTAELRSVQTVLRQLGASIVNLPPAIALTRGEDGVGEVRRGSVTIEPSRRSADLAIRLSEDGRLSASAEIPPFDSESNELSLYVVGSEGEWAFLGSAERTGTRWELQIERFSQLLGVTAGAIQTSSFALTEGQAVPKRQTVRLKLGEGFKAPGGHSSFWLTMFEAPSISDGIFKVGIELPPPVRDQLDGGVIFAALDLGASQFVFGEWRVHELPDSPGVSIATPVPGISDCIFELQSGVCLYARRD